MLLVLCENGFALEVIGPMLGEQDTVSTYQIKDLPRRYFHFCSIKSRIKVKDTPMGNYTLSPQLSTSSECKITQALVVLRSAKHRGLANLLIKDD